MSQFYKTMPELRLIMKLIPGRTGEKERKGRDGWLMRYEWIDEFLLAKKGVTKDLQKDWNWVRYLIGGKMFAAVCLGENGET